jgi:hypothetical protein
MKADKENDLRRLIHCHFGQGNLKNLIKVAKKMQEERKETLNELDAEYELGRIGMPPGYMKRRAA